MKNRETNERSRVKFRYMEVDVEGGNAAVIEGLRGVAAALTKGNSEAAKTFGNVISQRSLSGTITSRVKNNPENEELPLGMAEAPAEDKSSAPENAPFEEAMEDGEAASRPKLRRYPSCKLVEGINVDAGSPSLRALAEEKKPTNNNEKYMLCAFWLKRHAGLDAVTADHIYTCYQGMKWKPPQDVGHPLRDMKNRWFIQGPNGTWSLHSNGDAFVDRLPTRN